ncbi:MAG: coproporphyrinogen III oxidase family protein [bacterium]|nr:coproporphyrinogen III oxidase family protein [bacterium]
MVEKLYGSPREELEQVSSATPSASVAAAADGPTTGNYFVAAYPPFSHWTRTAVGELDHWLEREHSQPVAVPLGLYVHIPFCVKRCQYCYYLAYANKTRNQIDAYLDALLAELDAYARTPALAGRELAFVYFGGGTPSLLSPPRIDRLLSGLQAILPWNHAAEVTYESAPQTVTAARLRRLRAAGVTRLSLGVQQLDDEVLRLNGRVHQVEDVERAWAELRAFDFDAVNLDLMVGMVGETRESFHRSLERVIDWGPESVTIYQLEIPHNTPLFQAIETGTVTGEVPSWEVKHRRLVRAFARLEEAGYCVRSAYAAVRDGERHRFVYQDAQYRGADLLGIGVASFSYLGGVHHQNLTALEPYLESLEAGALPFGRAYVLNREERLVRELVLQLKLGRVEAEYFRRAFDVEISERFAAPLAALAERGWLTFDETGIVLTREGLVRADGMLPAFYLPQHRGGRYS